MDGVHQRDLFAAGEPGIARDTPAERIELDATSWVDVVRGFVPGADVVLDDLLTTVPWRQGRRWMYERMVDDPRLSHGFKRADPHLHPVLRRAELVLEARYRVRFMGVGLNYYRDGRDSVASHRDRDMRHLDDTLIAIVTLGARRPFVVKPHAGTGPTIDLSPASGDLLVMGGRCQADWEHGVPKVARAGPRVSASWRWTSRRGRPEQGGSWRSPRRFGPD